VRGGGLPDADVVPLDRALREPRRAEQVRVERLHRLAVPVELVLVVPEREVQDEVAEVLGDVLIRAGKFSDARAAYRKELAERPNSGFALHGIALSWEKEGNRAEAAKAYREFLTAWSHADPELSQVKRAQAYLSQQTVAINSH
jgi:tetratricopeptide (TPR) repeat protein